MILWTTPYKQLYKDPALVVRADECVGRIDHLVLGGAAALPPTVNDRFKAGIKDAESRYASMWTVYAFISDGLYYSGGLARLLRDHPCRRDKREHVKHLAVAQDELLRAIRVAWKWWALQKNGNELGKSISDDDLEQLLRRFVAHTGARTVEALDEEAARRRKLCGVDLEQYIHDEPGIGCKDVRYRFDNSADLERAIEDAQLNEEQTAAVRAFLGAVDVDIADIGHEELADIVFHMGRVEAFMRQVDFGIAAREGNRPRDDDLRRTWYEVELSITAGETDGPAADRQVSSLTPARQFVSGGGAKRSGHRRQRGGSRARQAESLPNLDEPADPTGTSGGGVPDTTSSGT